MDQVVKVENGKNPFQGRNKTKIAVFKGSIKKFKIYFGKIIDFEVNGINLFFILF